MNELSELVLKRRSTRKFKEKAISEDIINEIITIALTSLSSLGLHPIHFIMYKISEK